MDIDFKNIAYLQVGNERQKNVFRLLEKYAILEQLKEFDPIVVGTIPIDIDIESSDVDILLYSEDIDSVSKALKKSFCE
jgi:hypothetical protein